MKSKRIETAMLAAALLAFSVGAKADPVTVFSTTNYNLSTPSDGLAYGVHDNTAVLSLLTTSIGTFLSYCTDPQQAFGSGTFDRVLASDFYNATQTHLLQRLWYNAFAASTVNGANAATAAYQYAVWEITNDAGFLDLANGNIKVTGGALLTDVNSLLTAANTVGPETQLYLLKNATFQDLLIPVPEPTTWAMLLAGLGMLGFISRKGVRGA